LEIIPVLSFARTVLRSRKLPGWAVNKYIISYLQNDKEQDGGSTNVCLRIMLLMIKKGWVWRVKYLTDVNCNIFYAEYLK
jgi:hypothetical protein